MKEIPLTRGMVAIVDDSDYPLLASMNWHVVKARSAIYAVHNAWTGEGKRTAILMHRLITGFPLGEVDHVDCNGLHNWRTNLRVGSKNNNQWNRRKVAIKTSRFKGVSKDGSSWVANIRQHGIRVHLGSFTNEELAAAAYNAEALRRFGEFARLNPL